MLIKNEQKKILVMRYRFIGDTILTVPFLRNLRRAEPDAFIAWMVAPGSSEVVKGIPYVDELIYWDPVTIHADSRGTHRTLASKLAFFKELRSRHFDKVYVLKRSFSSALLAWLSGAKDRVGFDTEGRGFLLTGRVPYRHDQHEVQNFLDVLRADGVPVADDHLEAWISAEEQQFADQYMAEHGVGADEQLLAVHPFAANPVRGWHEDNFVEVANRLQRLYKARIVLFGGGRDVERAQYMRQRISPEPVMVVGSTTLRQTMAILARCQLLVCNDSGIMHLGAALGVPLVAIFGPQSPVKFGPWGKGCRVEYSEFKCSPCRQKFFTECKPSPRGKPECVEAVQIEQVIKCVADVRN
ncbi:ADP-heptose--lipopolysaccharide heptosyltransferase [Geotalea daltonii FRC-32]|uniref:lipopolysaccharide heptosyltransferase II n=1 Tax=Geotalea daltonii (strain DSM 22248 / JCM 15807 / FRC-32) TaxID=316067 RepID=B9M8X0_GEODF|nr:lipopolysaccharide heptosyltransferase II [Geotalea daltonii]ACM20466.1 ADP-heptose--lipopolysaccharide heptosyltransferase [Geotalea daltonii FRC-32]